jgi:Tfp pilus assembly protein PilW
MIELLVGMSLFAVACVGIYQVLFQTAQRSSKATDVATTTQEARLGFNRMVRDTREAQSLIDPTDTSFQIETDFNGDGVIQPSPAEVTGDYESLRFTFNQSATGAGTVTATAGNSTEVLMNGVDCVRKTDNTCQTVFTYSSSRLEYDTNSNGITSAAELDAAVGVGNANGVLDGSEVNYVDAVAFQLRTKAGTTTSTFYAEAQLRNHR